jgi:hypothetical protein
VGLLFFENLDDKRANNQEKKKKGKTLKESETSNKFMMSLNGWGVYLHSAEMNTLRY